VAVVSESMVRTWFGSADALGRSIVLGGNRDTMSIVGIVRDVRHEGLRDDAPRSVYTPLTQPTESFDGAVAVPDRLTVILRTSVDPELLTASVADQVHALGGDAAVSWMRTMQQQLDVAHVRERLLARMSAAFGLLALILATTGLYGVMSYHVARRSREIGIRMALGATRWMTMEHILRDVMIMAVAGIAAGTAVTLASTRVVASFLFGVSPHDPLTLAAVAAILLGTILLAGCVPARQAARLDPVRTLKAE
jgi:predicted lysophospholipase L1 biosynthesis ABC-type transport system permease subunit